jgi:regulator of protease activity HflC (stomatin/prohibitin superfamily)
MIRKFVLVAAASIAALSLAACGQTIDSGNVGIKIKNYGSGAGVQAQSLPTGWQPLGIGERIVEYPVITRTYQWTRAKDGDTQDNEEFAFNDSTGLPLTADLSITFKMDPQKVPEIYKTYKLDFDALRNGPIRAYVRTAVALEASKYTSDQLYTADRQKVIVAALADVQKHFANSGIDITDMQWIGSIRFPDSVTHAIEQKTAADQQAQVALRQVEVNENQAKARVAAAEGEAAAKVAQAKGEAEALRIQGEAIRQNPQVLESKYLDVLHDKWDGALPNTMLSGSNPTMMLKTK